MEVDGLARSVDADAVFERLGRHLEGIVGALWKAADRQEQHRLARDRHGELTAEAIVAALLAAEGLLGGWVLGDGGDPVTKVDDMLGRPQASALALAAFSVVPDDGPPLSSVVERHVAPGLVMPSAAMQLTAATKDMVEKTDPSHGRALLAALTMHAAARIAAGLPDPLARDFTRKWIALAWAREERPDDANLRRLVPPDTLVAQAVDPAAFADALVEATDMPWEDVERLARIAADAGYPDTVRRAIRRLPTMASAPAEDLRQALTGVATASDGPRRLIENLGSVLDSLVAAGREDELIEMTDHAIAVSDGNEETRALLLTQLGAAARAARTPALFLGHVGDEAEDWEKRLPDVPRLALATERSTALRLAGRPVEARNALEPFRHVPLDDANRWRRDFNMALITRDAGAADEALRETLRLLDVAPDSEAEFLAHQSLARTMTELGRLDDAVHHYRAALDLPDPAHAHLVPVLRASLATLLGAAGECAAAKRELHELADGALSPQAALGFADTVAVLLERGEELDATLVARALLELGAAREAGVRAGDVSVQASAFRIRARLHELLDDADTARADWQQVLRIRTDPLALVSLARLHWLAGRPDDARPLLTDVPEALLTEHGAATDLGAIIDVTGRLRAGLRRLATVMMVARPTPDDVRLAAELARDAVGRMLSWAATETAPPSRQAIARGLAREELAPLAPATGHLWVIEWWAGDQSVQTLQTRVGTDGDVAVRSLPEMPGNPPEIAARMRARLQGWLTSQPGDPLDHPGWRALAEWLTATMHDCADGDHLVVIEHAGLGGLPWHAVQPATWTTSYAPSWSALLDLSAPRPIGTTGLVSVPARGDSEATLAAFAQGARRAADDAHRAGIDHRDIDGADADADAVLDLLRACDLLALQCHGVIDPAQLDVALLVADSTHLPTQHPIAASSELGRAHRLGWRRMQGHDAAPEIVLSAACSTGQALIGGLGERLGIFAALRPRGTRAVVAPAWDTVAEDAVVQVADVRAALLDGSTVAAAVAHAGDQAAQHLPAWRARALCIVGDWR